MDQQQTGRSFWRAVDASPYVCDVQGPADLPTLRITGVEHRHRWGMACELASWMNGGVYPLWVDDLDRTDETTLHSVEGIRIEFVGPFTARKGRDHAENTFAAHTVRARHMDRLWFNKGKELT